jgi:FlaA1/EpsC-like NDP-sugar epimerase
MKRSHGISYSGPVGRLIRMFDLGLMGVILFASLAVSSGSLALPGLAYLLVIRVKVVNLFLLLGYLALCSAVLSASGFYRSHRLSTFHQRVHEVLLACTLLTLLLLMLRWPFQLDFASNNFLIAFWVISFVVLGATREFGQTLLYYLRSRGRNLRNVVIIGEGEDVLALAAQLQNQPGLGYRVVGTIDAKELDQDERYASAG